VQLPQRLGKPCVLQIVDQLSTSARQVARVLPDLRNRAISLASA